MKLAPVLTIALVAMFIAGSIVHARDAAAMDHAIAMATDGHMDMADCPGCGAVPGKISCDGACATPMLAVANLGTTLPTLVPAVADNRDTRIFLGRVRPPDPYPP